MATNIEDIVAGSALAGSKGRTIQVEQPTIPEATISVPGGFSSSLDIQDLGAGKKKRKDEPVSATSSTEMLAIEDMFGDLLNDDTDYSNPDELRRSIVERLEDMDYNTLQSISSSYRMGNYNVGQGVDQYANQYGVGAGGSFDDATSGFDYSLGTMSSSGFSGSYSTPTASAAFSPASFSVARAAALSGMGMTSPTSAAIGLMGQPVTGLSSLSSLSDLSSSLSFNDFSSSLSSIGALSSAYSAVSGLADWASSQQSVQGAFNSAVDRVSDIFSGAVSVLSDPVGFLDAVGMQMQYGTQTPSLFGFETPEGRVNYAFTDPTLSQVATPGFLGALVGLSPVGTAYNIGQQLSSDPTSQARGAIDALSMPGLTISNPATNAYGLGITSYSGPATGFQGLSLGLAGVPGFNSFDNAIVDITGRDPQQAIMDWANKNIIDYEELAAFEEAMSSMTSADFANLSAMHSDIQSAMVEAYNEMAEVTGVPSVTSAAELSGLSAALNGWGLSPGIDANTAALAGLAANLDPNAVGLTPYSAPAGPSDEFGQAYGNYAFGTYGPSDLGPTMSYESLQDWMSHLEHSAITGDWSATGPPDETEEPGGYSTETDLNAALESLAANELGLGRDEAYSGAYTGLNLSSEEDDIDAQDSGTGPGNAPGDEDYGDWASGFSGWGEGDGGDGGDGGGTHICTAAFKAGISPKERFRANRKYGLKLRREDPILMRGYDIVGPWVAKKIGHTGAGEFLTKIYEKQMTGKKMTLKERILFAILSNTVRPMLRVIGALC